MRMNETNISFYLKANRIHVFVEALRDIGSPKYIRFMISEDGTKLAMEPYGKKDFYSHRVSQSVYTGNGGMEVCSLKLCRLIADLHSWDIDRSYRVPGSLLREENVVIFDLRRAEEIERDDE